MKNLNARTEVLRITESVSEEKSLKRFYQGIPGYISLGIPGKIQEEIPGRISERKFGWTSIEILEELSEQFLIFIFSEIICCGGDSIVKQTFPADSVYEHQFEL